MRNLGSLRDVLAATDAELIEAGATKRQAEAIRKALGDHTPDEADAEDTAIENAFQPD